MSKATEEQLSTLHGVVAQVLTTKIGETAVITDEETGEKREISLADDSTISAAIKFLKDNNVTATIEEDDNLSELAEQLKDMQNDRGPLRLVGEE